MTVEEIREEMRIEKRKQKYLDQLILVTEASIAAATPAAATAAAGTAAAATAADAAPDTSPVIDHTAWWAVAQATPPTTTTHTLLCCWFGDDVIAQVQGAQSETLSDFV